jgi:hypothetical protein
MYLARVTTARHLCHIRIMAEGPIDSDAQLRLKANVDRAAQKATPARKRSRERLQFIRLWVERILEPVSLGDGGRPFGVRCDPAQTHPRWDDLP